MIHNESVFSSVGVNFRPLATDSLRHVVPLTRVLKVERGTSYAFAAAFLYGKRPFLKASRASFMRSSFELSVMVVVVDNLQVQ